MDNPNDWVERVAAAVEQAVADRFCRATATYRLQFARDALTFRAAAAIVPYLDALGISHVYASPCLKTRSGSANGYAVVDYRQLDPALGSPQDHREYVDALHARRMGQILDIVPNHMSIAAGENPWWNDVLENGPGSPYAAYFDIDWSPVKKELKGKVLLPLLGEQYGQVLESGELKLEYREGAFFIRYYDAVLPLEPQTYRIVLAFGLEELKKGLPEESEDLRELESILTALEHLPQAGETAAPRVCERQREKEVIKGRLARLTGHAPAVAEFVQGNVQRFNGAPGDGRSFDRLDELLGGQNYRLAHWKAAADEINYRRFFDISELAAVCMEDPKVFEDSHRTVCEWLARGDADGVRVDHIDGLYDPPEYLGRLQREYLRALGRAACREIAGEAVEWSDLEPRFLEATRGLRLPLYVVVEKILGPEEPLPKDWQVAGTTGYDFLNFVGGLFVDPAGLDELLKAYSRFVNERANFREVAYQGKSLILRVSMASELQLLAGRINRISERHRRSRDFTFNELRTALREILACFPVYRTYIHQDGVSEQDRRFICRAVAQAKYRSPARNPAVFDFIRDVLLLQAPPGLDEAGYQERDLFVGRFQQVTSPVTAKGIEDTAFYRYGPLVSLNEVGNDPARRPTTTEEFHRHNLAQQAEWPRSLICTSTHDTKRSEDVRARISVLSEIPLLWRAAVNRWARLNRRHRRDVAGQPAPSRNEEYLFYQNLLGVWPLEPPDTTHRGQLADRMQQYMEKATREAKLHTSWINPNAEYDAAVRQFVAAVLDDHPKNRFLADFRLFWERVVNWGLYSALSQVVLKLTSPGVPDIYQGQELWDFSLVDPDNRRPVDFAPRRELLAELQARVCQGAESLFTLARQLAENPRDPRSKLFVTWRTLQLRRENPDLFQHGDYVPLDVEGPRARHVCAFARLCRPREEAADVRSTGFSRNPGEEPPKGGTTNDAFPAAGGIAAEPGRTSRVAVVVVPRLIAQLTRTADDSLHSPPPLGQPVWQDTRLVPKEIASLPLTNLFTGQVCRCQDGALQVADLLSDFPVCVLTAQN
ncbi:MAG: malto-oligosyltrehalose synthase [Thermoguttaceae bacterium]